MHHGALTSESLSTTSLMLHCAHVRGGCDVCHFAIEGVCSPLEWGVHFSYASRAAFAAMLASRSTRESRRHPAMPKVGKVGHNRHIGSELGLLIRLPSQPGYSRQMIEYAHHMPLVPPMDRERRLRRNRRHSRGWTRALRWRAIMASTALDGTFFGHTGFYYGATGMIWLSATLAVWARPRHGSTSGHFFRGL